MPVFTSSVRRFSSTHIYNNILETIGNTPIVKINKLAPKNVNLYVKCEYFNPLSSVKDRMALAIIEDAEQRGVLKRNQTVIEATSGNTGIGLAMVCAQKGYPFVAVMAETYSIERRKIMRGLGAKVVLTPAKYGGIGMGGKAQELAVQNDWFLASQFVNDANPGCHRNTTAPEILSSFSNKNLDYWVTGWGTGGTFTGAGQVLKAARPDIKIVLCEPTVAPLIGSGIKQERDEATGGPLDVHPSWVFHPIQGWAPNFIPKIAEDGANLGLADEIVYVDPDDAMKTALDLAKNEGIFTGISGGATCSAALEVCKRAKDGASILAMLPDAMERYMSTPLFQDIQADMNEEETIIANSTPNYQLQYNTI